MTENKRFKVYKVIGSFHEWSIEDTVDDKIVFRSIMHKYEADRLCECLNSLADENTELKKENEQLKIDLGIAEDNHKLDKEIIDDIHNEFQKVKKENEQLKQFQDRVFSWIDMHLQRLPTLRDEEFESDDEFADPSLYDGAIQTLETMKRELKGD